MIALYKQEPGEVARYYSIAKRQSTAFSLRVVWGSSRTGPRERSLSFDSPELMEAHLRRAVRDRIEKGYRILYTFYRKDEYRSLSAALVSAGS